MFNYTEVAFMKEGPGFFLISQREKKKSMHYSELGGWDMVVITLKIRGKVWAFSKETIAGDSTSDSCPERRRAVGSRKAVIPLCHLQWNLSRKPA